MYRIKCSNGKYVNKTTYGNFITYTKNGKIFHSLNLVNKNLDLCEEHEEFYKKGLTYELETIR